MKRIDSDVLAPYIEHLRELPFARKVDLINPTPKDDGYPAVLKLTTARGKFTFALQVKQTFLDRALTNAVMAEHAAGSQPRPVLLVARYIPRPTGERLAEAGVNFVDRLGNMHLALGENHHVLRLGRREPKTDATARRPGPALVQLYFVLLADPAASAWSARRLADGAGIGKTAAATGLQRLVRLGILAEDRNRGRRIVDRPRLTDAFLQGYVNVLRPHLEVGRFRAANVQLETFLQLVADTAAHVHATWAATGAPAAYALDRFYRGDDVPLFIEGFAPSMQRTLRLVPDREGPISVLRPFGQHWAWKTIADVPVAHPWLVYAELIHRGEPRALEAADHIREQFLAA